MFPTSVGFGITFFIVISFLLEDWRKLFEPRTLTGVLIGTGILGLIGIGMLFYGIKGLLKIWANFFRIVYSRHYVFSGQRLAIALGEPKFTGLDEGESMKYHIGNNTFVIPNFCSPKNQENLFRYYPLVRVWYVPSTGILVKVETLMQDIKKTKVTKH